MSKLGSGLGLLSLLAATTAWHAAEAPAPGRHLFRDVTAASGIDFRNVCGAPAREKGWLTEAMGAGAAWLDYDGDGNLDLFLVNGSTHARATDAGEPDRLYRGDGKGRFVDVTAKAGVGHRGWGYGVAVGDIDNDGDPDIFVTNLGEDVLYRNNGDGTFTDITRQAGITGDKWSTSAAFFDADRDGDLDLYLAYYMESDSTKIPRRGSEAAKNLVHCTFQAIQVFCGPLGQVPLQDVYYRNNGDGTFTDATRQAGFWLKVPRYGLGVVTGDYDNDGDSDLYVANDSVQQSLWKNRGDGTFVDVAVESLAAFNLHGRPQAGMGTDFGDYNGDGWLDIAITTFSHDLKTLYRNMVGKYFIDDSAIAGMGPGIMALSWGVGFYDFDHDADQDLFIANGHVYPQVDDYDIGTRYRQVNHLFVNQGEGRFAESSAASGPGLAILRSFRGAAFGDYDNDGDPDILVTALDDAPLLLRNDGPDKGHYLQLRLIGTKSNRDAVGARVTLTAGGRRQIRERQGGGSYLSASDHRLHFGLGAAARAERIEVRWPSGAKDVLTDVAGDRLITIKEGSAPAASPK